MNIKRLLNYEFLRDNIMCMDKLNEQTAQVIKSTLLMACYDLSYLKFVDSRFFVDTRGGDKVRIILGLASNDHSTQVHYEISADSHCCNANIKRKFSVYEFDREHGTWKPEGIAELNDEAGELLSLIIKNIPKEFILQENAVDLPITQAELDAIPAAGKPATVKPEHLAQLKEVMDTSVDNKINSAAEKIQTWITDEFCPALQTWLEMALGRKLDSDQKSPKNEDITPDKDGSGENKSKLI